MYASGSGSYGQLGNGSTSDKSTPVQVIGVGGAGFLEGVVAVSAGQEHSLAMKSDGTVWAWGYGYFGQLGNASTSDLSTPVQVRGVGGEGVLTGVIAVSAGFCHNLALKSDGTVWAWGWGGYGELGIGSSADCSTPVQVLGEGGVGVLEGVVAVSAGRNHSLAVKSDGTVWAWGLGENGRLGNRSTNIKTTPVQVRGVGGEGVLTGVVAVSAGHEHSLAVKSDGTVWAWGVGQSGRLGNESTSDQTTPVQVRGEGGIGYLADVIAVDAGGNHNLAVKSDGTVWAWGGGVNGTLGNGSTNIKTTPVQVRGVGGEGVLTGVVAVSAGIFQSIAVKSDGTVWAWGYNYGQLGIGSTSLLRATPVQVRGVNGVGVLTEISAVSAGFYHSMFLQPDLSPISSAGPDQTISASHGGNPLTDTGTFTLDGTGSSDPDGDTLTYEWKEGATVVGTTAMLALSRRPGTHSFTLTVTDPDGEYDEDDVVVTVNPASNAAPTSNAGLDQTITASHGGNPLTDTGSFTLVGSASSDPDGDTLTYEWKEGTTVVGTSATLTLTRIPGIYTFTLKVTDPDGEYDEDDAVVTVNEASNTAPTSNAGSDQSVTASHAGNPLTDRGSFTLNGSASSDPEGDTLTYAWTEGSTVVGTSATLALSRAVGTRTFTLKVTDAYGDYCEDEVVVTVNAAPNRTPTANAGPDQTISSKVRVLVTLNGSSSSDPDGDGLTYVWSEGSVNIASGRTPTAYFLPGTHNVKLTVTDTYGGTSEDNVQIFVDSRVATTVKMQASIATRQGVALRMPVRVASNVTLLGKTLSYYVDNVLIGTVTSANPAYVNYTPSSSMSLGAHALKVKFEGDSTHQPSEATTTLTVKK